MEEISGLTLMNNTRYMVLRGWSWWWVSFPVGDNEIMRKLHSINFVVLYFYFVQFKMFSSFYFQLFDLSLFKYNLS
jgi:hypothetical protein